MSRKKSSAAKPWNAILRYKKELMKRDPLGKELTDCLLKLFLEAPKKRDFRKLMLRRTTLEDQLSEKYEVDSIYVPDPIHWDTWRRVAISREEIAELAWQPVGVQSPLSIEANFGLRNLIVVSDKGIITPETKPQPADDQDPILTVSINLAKIKAGRHIDRVVEEIRDHLREAFESLPSDLRNNHQPLTALRTIHESTFYQDLSRYDRHVFHGLTFRLIALMEELKAQGRTLDERRLRRPVSLKVSRESSVRESVDRIYEAIYREPYRARRKRLEPFSDDISTYQCPDHHDQECTEACTYMQQWRDRFNRTNPTDFSGSP